MYAYRRQQPQYIRNDIEFQQMHENINLFQMQHVHHRFHQQHHPKPRYYPRPHHTNHRPLSPIPVPPIYDSSYDIYGQPQPQPQPQSQSRSPRSSNSSRYRKKKKNSAKPNKDGNNNKLKTLPLNQGKLDKYRVQKAIGHGSFGLVVKADSKKESGPYKGWIHAIKLIATKKKDDKKVISDFIKEAKLTKLLNEKNIYNAPIIQFNEFFDAKHSGFHGPCMVTELLGISLSDWLKYRKSKKKGPIAIKTIRFIAKQIFAALHFLHNTGHIIHGDLKPHNIVFGRYDSIQKYPMIKIIDFGCSYEYDEYLKSFNVQPFCYRAPEVLFGVEITSKIDLWSVGAILTELIFNNKYTNIDDKKTVFKIESDTKKYGVYTQQLQSQIVEYSTLPIYVYNIQKSSFLIDDLCNKNICHFNKNYMNLKNERISSIKEKILKINNSTSNDPEFDELLDVISCLLDPNPVTRYSATDAFQHKFSKKRPSSSEPALKYFKQIKPSFIDDNERQKIINIQFAKYINDFYLIENDNFQIYMQYDKNKVKKTSWSKENEYVLTKIHKLGDAY